MAKIYTRHGDQGMTSLVGGTRLPKTHPRLHAYGTLDELNVCIGMIISELDEYEKCYETSSIKDPSIENDNFINSIKNILLRIQNELFVAGGLLACDNETWLVKLPQINKSMILQLENEIDHWTQDLPQLKNFILPGGHRTALNTHFARTVCRRAERWTLSVIEESRSPQYEMTLQYLNRLSDHLFTLSRWLNHKFKKPETSWIPS